MNKWIFSGIMTILSFSITAQTLLYDSGYTTRNKVLSHYNKMVDWDDSQYKEFTHRNVTGTKLNEFMNFRAIFPPRYNKNNPQKYPVIVMLHGAGESGRSWEGVYDYDVTDVRYDNNGHNLLHGGYDHREAVNRPSSHPQAFPGIVIFPQASYNGSWESGWASGVLKNNGKMVAGFIEYMAANYNADINRVYMHGLSNGAKGVWDLSSKRPDLFAAVLPMSGVGTNRPEMSKIHSTTPVWLFQGDQDSNPTLSAGQTMINSIIAEGGTPRFTVYANTGHGTWYAAYAEPDFFSWMLAQDKRNIYLFGGKAQVCQGDSLKMGFSAGFNAYQWTLNGADIAGATTRFLKTTVAGTYKVKFKRNDNVWYESFPTTINLVAASTYSPALTFTGSLVLPIDISSKNVVDLNAPDGFSEYSWYKDNVLVATTTSKTRNILSGVGTVTNAGSYTVVVREASGCRSLKSPAVVAVFKSPHTGPATPTLGTFTAPSSTQATINWTDTSGEEYYEIWRSRKAANGYLAESHKLVSRTAQNSTTFTDSGLNPNAQYYYRVRAMAAGDGLFSAQKQVNLPEDTQAPTTPTNLVVTNISGVAADLSWGASTDNDVVALYQILLDGTPVDSAFTTSLHLTNLIPGTVYTLSVKAIDARGNVSGAVSAALSTPVNGLYYSYYETGSLSDLATFNFSQPTVETGTVNNFDISVRNRDDQFLFSFDGFIQIDEIGTYTFYTASDDGSLLYINGTLVVNNDGLHGVVEQSGTYTFSSTGRFPIKVTFFENGGGEYLQVQYDPAGSEPKQLIPASKLTLTGNTAAKKAAAKATGEIAVSPNPFTNQITITLNGQQPASISIINADSFTVKTIAVPAGASEVLVDTSGLTPGVYYVNTGSTSIRIVRTP